MELFFFFKDGNIDEMSNLLALKTLGEEDRGDGRGNMKHHIISQD